MAQVKNDFSQGSIPRNILSLALPMTAAQLVNVLYSVVDRIYLGRSKQAVFFSLLRKAIINAPLTVILPIWMGTTGVFTAEAVSQLVGGLACFITMYCTVYRPLGRLKDGAPLPARP